MGTRRPDPGGHQLLGENRVWACSPSTNLGADPQAGQRSQEHSSVVKAWFSASQLCDLEEVPMLPGDLSVLLCKMG